MREIAFKVRRMSEENLKDFDRGRWNEAYEISYDNFDSYLRVRPSDSLENIVEFVKKNTREL